MLYLGNNEAIKGLLGEQKEFLETNGLKVAEAEQVSRIYNGNRSYQALEWTLEKHWVDCRREFWFEQ
jgi:hypothetical protein